MKISYYEIRKGLMFKHNITNDRYVVVDYDITNVFLIKLAFKSFLPFTRVRKVRYDVLNTEYVEW